MIVVPILKKTKSGPALQAWDDMRRAVAQPAAGIGVRAAPLPRLPRCRTLRGNTHIRRSSPPLNGPPSTPSSSPPPPPPPTPVPPRKKKDDTPLQQRILNGVLGISNVPYRQVSHARCTHALIRARSAACK